MRYKIKGGNPLQGEVIISGSKHTALAILGSLPLLRRSVKLSNIPEISDVLHMIKLNESFGINCLRLDKNEYFCTMQNVSFFEKELWRVNQLRSSILYLGSLLARCGYVSIPIPGGDRLGKRSMEEFLSVLDGFGIENAFADKITAKIGTPLKGNREIDLCNQVPILGNNKTALAIMLACANNGKTTIRNAIVLSEITELCRFLQLAFSNLVQIEGIETNTLTVSSPGIHTINKKDFSTYEHVVDYDKCELSFWIAASTLTRGDIIVTAKNVVPRILKIKQDLKESNIPLSIENPDQVKIKSRDTSIRAFHLVSSLLDERGIALDACPLLATMLMKAKGKGSFRCIKFGKGRIRWTEQLSKVGANCKIVGNTLVTEGQSRLFATEEITLSGYDIRGASALLLCALGTEGDFPVYLEGIEHIQRGMEDVLQKLQALGAKIEVID